MPARFERASFTGEQAEILAREFHTLWIRIITAVGIFLLVFMIPTGAAIWAVQRSSDEHDSNLRQFAKINRAISITGLQNSYISCRNTQELGDRLNNAIHISIPRHAPGRTPEEQTYINNLYHELKARGVLHIPQKCPKPPPGGATP